MASRRVLLVDDDDHIREVTQLALEATMGWDVVPVSSGLEALEQASSSEFGVILLDVMMPEMDGPTTFEKLREIPEASGTPVLLLTAKTQQSDLDAYEAAGVNGTIQKPFDPMTLGNQMAQALGWTE
ncbi:MAG: response regulator [Chloroflexi bacterium]|nr:response regulator [Chloroflexota bacterium]